MPNCFSGTVDMYVMHLAQVQSINEFNQNSISELNKVKVEKTSSEYIYCEYYVPH